MGKKRELNGWTIVIKRNEYAKHFDHCIGATYRSNYPDQTVGFFELIGNTFVSITVGMQTVYTRLNSLHDLLHKDNCNQAHDSWNLLLGPFEDDDPSLYARSYAGAGTIVPVGEARYLFFHAEDQDQRLGEAAPGIPGFYASIGLAEITGSDGNLCVFRRQRLLTSFLPKILRPAGANPNDRSWAAQGLGDPSVVCVDNDCYLYATHYGGRFCRQGIQTVLLKCPLGSIRDRFSWQKWSPRGFVSLDDSESFEPVISDKLFAEGACDCIHASVLKLNCGLFIAAFSRNARDASGHPDVAKSGVCLAWSTNGIEWSLANDRDSDTVTPVFSGAVFGEEGFPSYVHPTIYEEAQNGTGWLLFGHSHNYNHANQPYHLHWASWELIRNQQSASV